MDTSLIIIGAGPGGYETAIAAAHAGISTVLIEVAELGGTCLNEGCIPTKCFCRNAEVLDTVREAAAYGVTVGDTAFELSVAVQRKNEIVAQLKNGVSGLLKSDLIHLVFGKAKFVGPHTVAVGEETYSAPHIIIATGSETKSLPIPGVHEEGVLTSREMLDLETVPQRLCVIGGGVIGLEFASIYQSFGSEVSVVEYAKEILPAFDRDLAKRLRTTLKKRGIAFYTGAAVRQIVHGEDGLAVDFDSSGKEGHVVADVVLMAVGRKPRVEDLELEEAGIVYTPRGITVDECLQTNVEGVYAIGDVNGICPLAHAATAQGKAVLRQITGHQDLPHLKLVPAAVFTVPELATAGLTEEQAAEQGIAYQVRKSFYRANGKALAMGASEGMVKILVAEDHQILGAHIMGAHAADLIHEIALAMDAGVRIEQLADLVHAHPSLSEIIYAAAQG